ncbi:MAG: hypothetical protein V1820_04360 [archaeon]
MATNAQILVVLAISFALGFFAGHIYGNRLSAPKKFYKYPSAHWKIRKR